MIEQEVKKYIPANKLLAGTDGELSSRGRVTGYVDGPARVGAKNIDVERQNTARVYDYSLGGAGNLNVDREFAEKLLATNPEMAGVMRHNRAFLGRAVRFCVDQASGSSSTSAPAFPTVGNVHEIAQSMAPRCRVVYVDHEQSPWPTAS